MQKIAIIASLSNNRVIGVNNQLPWKLSSDMKRFKKLTTGDGRNAVIMGRNTFDSLPDKFKPLPNRLNVVVSSTMDQRQGVYVARSLTEALGFTSTFADQSVEQVFIIGGGQIYAEALVEPSVTRMYLTRIEHDFSGDTAFPRFDRRQWGLVEVEQLPDAEEWPVTFETYERREIPQARLWVDPDNARKGVYRRELEEIQNSDRCPFCEGGYTRTNQGELAKVVFETETLWVKHNSYPIGGAVQHHFIIVPKAHVESIEEVPAQVWFDLRQAMAFIREQFGSDTGVLNFRNGPATEMTGATVLHSHWQYYIPNPGQTVKLLYGPPPLIVG